MPYPDILSDATMAEITRRIWANNPDFILTNPVGESVYARGGQATGSTQWTNSRLQLCGFTAKATQNISQMRMWSSGTAAGATPTLVRMGVYQMDTAVTTLTLVASTVNDTTLFAAANTTYTKSFSSAFQKVAGTYYMAACLVVSGAAMPTTQAPAIGTGIVPYATDNWLLQPPTCALVGSQADLPATIAVGTLTNSLVLFHALLLQ